MGKFDEIPDDVLLEYLLPHLTIRSAAQTSIISKRWRNLTTTYFTDLDFHPESTFPGILWLSYDNTQQRRYIDCINQIINTHRGHTIDKFRVMLYGHQLTCLDSWFTFSISKKVKELVLRLYARSGVYTLGVDILSHPHCDSGIGFLRKLHLACINVTGEFLELLLVRCPLLEQLHVERSFKLVTLKVNHCKLKHLTLQYCDHLNEIEIHASSLIYFDHQDRPSCDFPNLVFKSVPSLVEAKFSIHRLFSPVFDSISCFSSQLSKLSLSLKFHVEYLPAGIIPTFPNVITLELVIRCEPRESILPVIHFIKAFPLLRLFTLMVKWLGQDFWEDWCLQSVQDSEVAMDNGSPDGNPEFEAEIEHEDHANAVQSPQKMGLQGPMTHPNLRIFQLVGFRGCNADVWFTMRMVKAFPIKTVICDTRDFRHVDFPKKIKLDEIQISRRRARKFSKVLQLLHPKTKVVRK